MKRFTVLLAFLTMAVTLSAQSISVNTKTGKVSEEEIAMTTYPLDTAATALVLCEDMDARIDIDGRGHVVLITDWSARIKILKEAGKQEVDFKIMHQKDDMLGSVNVATYNLVDGKIKKTKLDKKYIFRENVHDDLYSCSFSAPEVQVGSVVEVSYHMSSPYYWEIPELTLQRGVPINHIHVAFSYPEFMTVSKMVQGYYSPHYKQESNNRHYGFVGLESSTIYTDNFTLDDVPALIAESHCKYPRQYGVHIKYNLSQIVIPGVLYETISKRWEDVDKALMKSNVVTQCMVSGHIVDQFKSTAENEEDAIVEVRQAVCNAIKYNGTRTLAPKDIKTAIKEGTGGSATINAVVASTLNQMGYTTYPVVLRKRSTGLLGNHYVRQDAFNVMILKITTPSGKVHYLDAAETSAYLDIINPDFLVSDARVLPVDTYHVPVWEDLTPLGKNLSSFVITANLDEDGIVRGEIAMAAYFDGSYLVKRTRRSMDSDEKYIEFVGEGENFETVSYEVEAMDYSPVAKFKINYEQEPTAGGDFVYVNPFLVTTHHESDFPDQERHMPIDFDTYETINYRYQLTFPETYEVAELPAPLALRSDAFKGRVACQFKQMGDNTVMLQFTYKNESLMANAADYVAVRAFWEQLCNVYKSTIVLKKK